MQLIDFAIRRRVTVLMCTVAIALFGLVSLSRLNLNLLPDLSYPTLTIRTELPGAAPLELETLVTRPVEEAVSIIRNVRQVRSVSRAGRAGGRSPRSAAGRQGLISMLRAGASSPVSRTIIWWVLPPSSPNVIPRLS